MDTLTNYGFEVRQENQQYFLFIDNKKITEVSNRFSMMNEPLLINENNDFIFNIDSNKVRLLTINSKTLKYSIKENILEFLKINIEDGIDSYSKFFAVLYENGDSEIVDVFDNFSSVLNLNNIKVFSKIKKIELLTNNLFVIHDNSVFVTIIDNKGKIISKDKIQSICNAKTAVNINFSHSKKSDFSEDLYYLYLDDNTKQIFNSKTLNLFDLKQADKYHFFTYNGKKVLRVFNKEKIRFSLYDSEFNVLFEDCPWLFNTEELFIYKEREGETQVYSIDGTFLFEEKDLYFIHKQELKEGFVYICLYRGHKFMIKSPDLKQKTDWFYFSDVFKNKWFNSMINKGNFTDIKDYIFIKANTIIAPSKKDLTLWEITYENNTLSTFDLDEKDNVIYNLFFYDKVGSSDASKIILSFIRLIKKSFVRFEVIKEMAVTIYNFQLTLIDAEKRSFFNTVLETQILTDEQQKEIMKTLEFKKRTSKFDKKSISKITLTTKATAKKIKISNEDLINYSNLFGLWN